MLTLKEIIEKRAKLIEEMKAMLDLADNEKRDLTEEEEAKYTEFDNQIPGLDKEIERRQKLAEREEAEKRRIEDEKKSARIIPMPAATFKAKNAEEFENLGEFIYSVRFRRDDPRLYNVEYREQSMGAGDEGGFMVPVKFRQDLMMVAPETAIFRPRATVLPATYPPDSQVIMPALEQGANRFGGIDVNWIAEGATKPETDMRLREICLTPHEVAGYCVITDKLLRNWTGCSTFIGNLFRGAIIAAEEFAFLTGNGVGRPLGITNAPASILYGRAAANTIGYADIVGMLARLKMGGNPIWITSQTTIPQLTVIQDAANRYIWNDAVSGMPARLMGIPVFFHERLPALGTQGDLMLVDLSYYLIQDGSGPFVMASEHVYFTSNKTVIKAFWNVDGQPWLNAPIPLEGSVANTVSPFIILN